MNSSIFTASYQTYISDTDAGGIVYHANYLNFYEHCRRDFFRHLSLNSYFINHSSTDSLDASIQIHPVVVDAHVKYKQPILLDMQITTTIDQIILKNASIIFKQSIYHAKNTDDSPRLLSTASFIIALVSNDGNQNIDSIKPSKLPTYVVDTLQTYC